MPPRLIVARIQSYVSAKIYIIAYMLKFLHIHSQGNTPTTVTGCLCGKKRKHAELSPSEKETEVNVESGLRESALDARLSWSKSICMRPSLKNESD